jgi:hypothetical protein
MGEGGMVKSRAWQYPRTGGEPMRREGLQARGAYKEMPRPGRGYPWELPGVHPSKE